jgi:uncharacterized membrane protein
MVFAIAALLTVLSGILSGIAHSIQRRSLDDLPELTPRAFIQRHFHLVFAILTTPLWLLGGVLAVSGALLRWQAFAVADVSILKPLTNVNILVVVFICVRYWGERMGHAEWAGISSMLIGIVLLVIASDETGQDMYNIPMYMLCSIICIICVGFFALLGSIRKDSARDKELFFALSAGILYGIATIFLKAMNIEVAQILGVFDLLNPDSWVVLATRISFWMYVISSVVAFFLLQCAYSRRRASVALPLNNSLSTIVPIVIAVLVFGDQLIQPIGIHYLFPFSFLRPIGITAILVGIIMLRHFQGISKTRANDLPP